MAFDSWLRLVKFTIRSRSVAPPTTRAIHLSPSLKYNVKDHRSARTCIPSRVVPRAGPTLRPYLRPRTLQGVETPKTRNKSARSAKSEIPEGIFLCRYKNGASSLPRSRSHRVKPAFIRREIMTCHSPSRPVLFPAFLMHP